MIGASLNHTFSGPLIKIARARKHLAELEAEIAAFLSTERVHWIDRRRITSRALDWLTSQARALTRRSAGAESGGVPESPIELRIQLPPEDLSAIIGDVVHNLRSALDLTACDMVRAVEGKDANVERVYFPFCRGAEDLETTIRLRQFHRAGERAVELLRGLKPYRGGNAALRAIHDLDIQDKHSALVFAKTRVAIPIISKLNDDGTPHISFPRNPRATWKVTVIFPPGSVLAGQEIIPTLHQLVELALGVVEAFRAHANS
jgi:hypothetical protein